MSMPLKFSGPFSSKIGVFCTASSGDGIVNAHENVPIVHQEAVCQGGEFFDGLIVVNDDRLFADVSAGHDHALYGSSQ